MGIYEKVGEFNNHPLYFLNQNGYNNYLYFKMDRRINDINLVCSNQQLKFLALSIIDGGLELKGLFSKKLSIFFIHPFFPLSGLERDGWTIGESPSDFSFAITTRQRPDCPNEVTFGYDRDLDLDATFSIACME